MMNPKANEIPSRSPPLIAGATLPDSSSAATTDPGPTSTSKAVPIVSANARWGSEYSSIPPLLSRLAFDNVERRFAESTPPGVCCQAQAGGQRSEVRGKERLRDRDAARRRQRLRGDCLVLGLPLAHRAAELEVSHEAGERREPEGDRAVAEKGEEGAGRGAAEGKEGADHAAVHSTHSAGERQRVGERAYEVAHHDHGDRGRRTEGVERGPQHGDVEAPPRERAQQARLARARQAESAAHAGGHGKSDVANTHAEDARAARP